MQLADESNTESRIVGTQAQSLPQLDRPGPDGFPQRAVHARLVASPLFECIRQEDFGAHLIPPSQCARAEVQDVRSFIGLIGMRRGWEPPDGSDKRSTTEMEYDWAKEIAPRFLYVAPEDFPVPGDLRETTSNMTASRIPPTR